MALTLPLEELAQGPLQEALRQAAGSEPPVDEDSWSLRMGEGIGEGRATLEEIDRAIDSVFLAHPRVERFLRLEKAWLLLQHGLQDEALSVCNEALDEEETPFAWLLKAATLSLMHLYDEAFHAFQKAYSVREKAGRQREEFLKGVFMAWSGTALLRSLVGIAQQDSQMAQEGVEEYLAVLETAISDGLESTVMTPALYKERFRGRVKGQALKELQEAFYELDLMIRLLSIKDPFDRWRALSQEISKVWPKGVSAVDAIREQRDREWNR
jgi:tetratricopeptide (TPR) repeat protein